MFQTFAKYYYICIIHTQKNYIFQNYEYFKRWSNWSSHPVESVSSSAYTLTVVNDQAYQKRIARAWIRNGGKQLACEYDQNPSMVFWWWNYSITLWGKLAMPPWWLQGGARSVEAARRGRPDESCASCTLHEDCGVAKKSGCIGLRLFPSFTQLVDRMDERSTLAKHWLGFVFETK